MMNEYKIYLVDDDRDFREATKELLDNEGLPTLAFDRGKTMLSHVESDWDGVILCDVKMPGLDGFDLLGMVQELAPEIPFLMMTGHGDIPMAISAMKKGAYGFVEKPVQPEYLLGQIRQALKSRQLTLENHKLRRRILRFKDLGEHFIGTSQAIKLCRKKMLDVAQLPLPVLIFGEPGVGKALAAHTIHKFSEAEGDFVDVNCATLTEKRLYKTFSDFQHEYGTIFLRGLHQLPLSMQSVLTDYLRRENRIRIIASIKDNPADHLADGSLLEEVFYLMNVATIEIPPLRDRGRDIVLLLDFFMEDASRRFNKRRRMVSPEQLGALQKYSWPGNVRELRSAAERIIIGLPVELHSQMGSINNSPNLSYDQAMFGFEKSLLEQALMETGGHKGEAAALLGIPRKRLYLRLKAAGLHK